MGKNVGGDSEISKIKRSRVKHKNSHKWSLGRGERGFKRWIKLETNSPGSTLGSQVPQNNDCFLSLFD
jgi:hypothetical protein